MQKALLYIALAQAAVATAGSLFFSEVLQLPPCVLCWYQRILMYPLVFILAVGILRKDRGVVWYALPLAIVGWAIALYHTLLQWNIIPEAAAPCLQGISCTTVQINLLGFITIPFMAFVAFSVIVGALGLYIQRERKSQAKEA